jgi:hypothetical protein
MLGLKSRERLFVKQSRWALIFCLLGTVLLLALPPIDMPETAFNEMDLPATASHVTLPRLRLAAPAAEAVPVANLIFQRAAVDFPEQSQPITRSQRVLSLQPLFCTFLI